MMRNGPSFQTYYREITRLTHDRLDWEPLIWDESQKTVEPYAIKRQRSDEFFERTYQVEEQHFRIRIPISPHPQRAEYFKFQPSKFWGSEPEWKFEDNVLILEVLATEQAVNEGLEQIRFWLGNRNSEIEEGNKHLRDHIRPAWEAKRKQIEDRLGTTNTLLQKLNIPLHQDPFAKTKPIEIKPRQMRTVIEKPKSTSKSEPNLNKDDVVSLVDFIERYSQQFEVAPRTYQKMGEEELRDLLVGMMNANYPGSTTSETFNKLGKTDISLRVDSGHVLICECKFWSGAKAYSEAIDQLFNYLTWRQNYGVLLHFCKLKEMTTAISEGKRATTEHTSFTTETLHSQSDTRFTSRHAHPQDASRLLEVFHLFVDLSI